MIWYIFNARGQCIGTRKSKMAPNKESLENRGEFAILADDNLGNLNTLVCVDGQIKKLKPIPQEVNPDGTIR